MFRKKKDFELNYTALTYEALIRMKNAVDQEVLARGTTELDTLKERLLLIAEMQGVEIEELFKTPRKKREIKARYRDPETGDEWSGMGKMKRWLQEKIDAGAKLEDFAIN